MKTRSVGRMLLLASVFACATAVAVWSQDAPAPAATEPPKQVPEGSAPAAAGSGTITGENKSDAATSTRKAANEKIAIHDILAIAVKEDPAKLNGYYRVDPKGMIAFGYAGVVPVEGLNGDEAARKLKEILEAKYLQKATVSVEVNAPMPVKAGLAPASPPILGTVWVMGQVNNKGQQTIPPNQNLTVSKVILQAGIAQFAKLSKTKLVRMVNGKREEIIVNVHDVIYKGKIEADVPVQKDDWIIVPQGMFPDPS